MLRPSLRVVLSLVGVVSRNRLVREEEIACDAVISRERHRFENTWRFGRTVKGVVQIVDIFVGRHDDGDTKVIADLGLKGERLALEI